MLRDVRIQLLVIAAIVVSNSLATRTAGDRKQAIAHRGASSYAPEHTLAAYRLALEQKADYVEQDLAVTRDGVLICLHDDTLERTSNVAAVFPDRSTNRRWVANDFTLAEIRRLDMGAWFGPNQPPMSSRRMSARVKSFATQR